MADEFQKVENENQNGEFNQDRQGRSWIGMIIRFIVAAIVLMITSFLTPGFEDLGFGNALLAAIVIAIMDWLIQRLFKIDASPFGRGISGFLIAALIIWLTQFFVPGMTVNLFGALIAALVIGIIDAVIPTNVV